MCSASLSIGMGGCEIMAESNKNNYKVNSTGTFSQNSSKCHSCIIMESNVCVSCT